MVHLYDLYLLEVMLCTVLLNLLDSEQDKRVYVHW